MDISLTISIIGTAGTLIGLLCQIILWPKTHPYSDNDLTTLIDRLRWRWINEKQEMLRSTPRLTIKKELLSTMTSSFHQANNLTLADNRISVIFEQVGKLLLILGQPGAGKTISLLELGEYLIDRAKKDLTNAVPVVLDLSSWNGEHRKFINWLTQEINAKYNIRKGIARALLKDNKLILLLDSLDEVNENKQQSCINAINEFIHEYGPPGIVVCCRLEAYRKHSLPLQLNAAINLLTPDARQINNYFSKAGAGKLILDPELQLDETLRTPFMLNMILQTYRDHLLTTETISGQHVSPNDIFHSFLDRVFELRSQANLRHGSAVDIKIVDDKRFRSWLIWLAWQTEQQRLNEFSIESLQPSWLLDFKWRVVYTLVSRIIGSSIVMAFGIAILRLSQAVGWLLGRENTGEGLTSGLLNVEQGLLNWFIITGIFGGLTVGIIDLFRMLHNSDRTNQQEQLVREKIFYSFLCALMYILICGLVFFVTAILFGFDRDHAIYGGLIYGIAFGIVFWFRGLGRGMASDINIAEKITWSWAGTPQFITWGLLSGLLLGAVSGLIIYLLSGFRTAFALSSVICLSGCLVSAIVGGYKVGIIKKRTLPNQGIPMSIINVGRIWLYVSIPFIVLFWTYATAITRLPKASFQLALFFSLVVGLLISFSYHGFSVVYHYMLRLILIIRGDMPLNSSQFFNYACRLMFLLNIAGGYKFIHETFRYYLARQYGEKR